MKKRWRDESLRLKYHDYSGNGAYFVTLCTKDRIPYFGNVLNSKMKYSPIGRLAREFWAEIPLHFPFVELEEFAVMPDHLHGIVVINKKRQDLPSPFPVPVGMPKLGIPSVVGGKGEGKSPMGGKREEWKPGSLGVIINQFKRICTIHARKIHAAFAWQPGYYYSVIRDDKGFYFISEYIKNNPKNWSNKDHIYFSGKSGSDFPLDIRDPEIEKF